MLVFQIVAGILIAFYVIYLFLSSSSEPEDPNYFSIGTFITIGAVIFLVWQIIKFVINNFLSL